MKNIRVEHSDGRSIAEASGVDELDRLLDGIAATTSAEFPIIVLVYAHNYQVGLGAEERFLHFELESGEPPYMISVGDDSAEGELAFYLSGNHHTEISRRNLIPAVKARQALYEWIRTEVRPSDIEWEEV